MTKDIDILNENSWLKTDYGLFNKKENIKFIKLSNRDSLKDVLRVITLVHELMHEIYPNWQEPRVERESKKVFRGLTVPQLGFFQFFVMTKGEIQSALKRQQIHSPLC